LTFLIVVSSFCSNSEYLFNWVWIGKYNYYYFLLDLYIEYYTARANLITRKCYTPYSRRKALFSRCFSVFSSLNQGISEESTTLSKSQLGPYLAGLLLESDGSIVVPSTLRSPSGKIRYPGPFGQSNLSLQLKIYR
jgi:hypothetical protein